MTVGGAIVEGVASTNRLRVDFLYLDLATCTRCRGTDRNLESALDVARELLGDAGTEVEVRKIHVTSAEQAHELRFRSSPTIRVNGRDIALELRASSCGAEARTDRRGDSIACRVWVHHGEEHTEPPVAMITEAVLRAVGGGAGVERDPNAGGYELPENLERFFSGEEDGKPSTQEGSVEPAQAGCCRPSEQRSCCEPEDKAECCGAVAGGSCGCR